MAENAGQKLEKIRDLLAEHDATHSHRIQRDIVARIADVVNGGDAVEEPQLLRADPDGPPPALGPGSSLNAWRAYAVKVGVDVPEDASKSEVQRLVDEAAAA